MVARRPMGTLEQPIPATVVILADGTFPSHPQPMTVLRSAETLVCTDGSADGAIRHNLAPHVIIGDMDSLRKSPDDYGAKVVHRPGQESTDLEKALDWCIEKGATQITLLGATGSREDHTLANFLILNAYSEKVKLSIMTDYSEIYYIEGSRRFGCERGQTISLLPLHEISSVTTEGLKYEIKGEPLRSGGHGISNKAVGNSFSVTVNSDGLFVFISHLE